MKGVCLKILSNPKEDIIRNENQAVFTGDTFFFVTQSGA